MHAHQMRAGFKDSESKVFPKDVFSTDISFHYHPFSPLLKSYVGILASMSMSTTFSCRVRALPAVSGESEQEL